VARPSLALEELTRVMQGVRTLAFRATPDLADALGELSARTGQTVGYLIREAVTQYITDANSSPPREGERRENTVRAPIPLQVMQQSTGASGSDLPVVADVQPVVMAGPGALRAAEPTPLELHVRKHHPPGEG
jgi:predicted DNA-binding protein